MMPTIMPEKTLSILSIVLAVIIQNKSLSFVAAELKTDAVHGSRRLETLPVRSTRIHGGWNTKEDRYSYAQVNLKWELEGHQCGGSVVAPDMILTAGHCKESFDKIEIGKHEKNDITDLSEEFDPDFEILHPDFDEETTRFDVMLVKLKGTTTMATPVRINKDEALPPNGMMLTVIGMGYNGLWQLPDVFQETDVQYQVNDQCEKIVDENDITLKGDLYPDMLCAGSEGRDSCYGDSGSPLVLKGSNEQEDIQVGVVSWGYECAGTLPGVYSRLSHSHIYNFVEENVCLYSDNPPDYMDCDNWTMPPTFVPTYYPTKEPTKSPSAIPTSTPTSYPTQTASPTIESEAPTTLRLKEALSQDIFLHESDLTLKTTSFEDDVLPPEPRASASISAVSLTRCDVAIFALFNVIWAFTLS